MLQKKFGTELINAIWLLCMIVCYLFFFQDKFQIKVFADVKLLPIFVGGFLFLGGPIVWLSIFLLSIVEAHIHYFNDSNILGNTILFVVLCALSYWQWQVIQNFLSQKLIKNQSKIFNHFKWFKI